MERSVLRNFPWREFNPEEGVALSWELAGSGSVGDQDQDREIPGPELSEHSNPEIKVRKPVQTICKTLLSLKSEAVASLR